ncbi:MAG: methyl-accepting chemotaxis protein, partial [Humidesulfovibrio sp.]|uniref:methyl-accepting chemotaxis protein n=1 Tax=Humidesulfovibrio sp. TaxID=2910988 RepID=UPI0027325276
VTSLSLFLAAQHFASQGFNDEAKDNIRLFETVVEKEVIAKRENTLKAATSLAQNPHLVQALAEKDKKTLHTLLKQQMNIFNAGTAFVTDAQGVIIARGHSEKAGDSASDRFPVAEALRGKGSASIEQGKIIKYAILGAHPIERGDTIIGVVALGMEISGEAHVDEIKALTGLEVTIFEGDMRISTTIMKDGKRAVGTKMDNPKVLEAVLQKGGTFLSQNTILGKSYETAYWPLKDGAGKILGMFFIGKDRSIIEAAQNRIFWAIFIAAAAISIVMGGLGLLFARSLARPLKRTADFAEKVAQGDLERVLDVKRDDEIGTLADTLRHMVERLRGMILESDHKSKEAEELAEKANHATARAEDALKQAAQAKREGLLHAASQLEQVVGVVSSASEELSAQIEQSRRGADHQSQRVAETATAMEEMNATVLEVAHNASRAAETSENARKNATHGAQIVAQVVAGINEVQRSSEELKTNMAALGRQADGIGTILSVISDIADQTNLLALNAAIEAARAGDAGRGFAVVADEVRKLAEKTMTATKEVGDAIRGIQDGTHKNILGVDRSVEHIQKATTLAQDSGQALQTIVGLVESSSDQVRSIATAAEQQSATSEEINRSVDDISRISNDTANAMSHASTTVVELARQAQTLKNLTNQLRSEGQQV